jgi:hypothetical protein
MTTYLFVDESKRSDYLIASAAVEQDRVAALRRELRGLLLPGQRRLHMVKERPARQRLILSTISRSAASVTIYRVPRGSAGGERAHRHRCLDRLIAHASAEREIHLVLELDETLLHRDRATLYAATRRERCVERVRYRHEVAGTELLLAIPDAVAWAWAQGGDWRRRASESVSDVIDLGPA